MADEYVSAEEMRKVLKGETPEGDQRLATLIRAFRRATKQEAEVILQPTLAQLTPAQYDHFWEIAEQIDTEELDRSRDAGARATLHDLSDIGALTAEELKAITVGALYFVAFKEKRDQFYDTEGFFQLSRTQPTTRLRRIVHLLFLYYFGYEMPRSAENVELFKIEGLYDDLRAFVAQPSEDLFTKVRVSVLAHNYTAGELKRINKALRERVERNVKDTYAAFHEDLNTRYAVAKAWGRMGGRALALALLLIMCRGVSLNLDGFFRKTSKEYARDAVVQVYTEHMQEVERVTRNRFQNLTPQQFDESKARLAQALERLVQEQAKNIEETDEVIVMDPAQANQEIENAFRNQELMTRVEMNLSSIQERWEQSEGVKDFVIGFFDNRYTWKDYKSGEIKKFREDVQNRIHELFAKPEFTLALEKDKRSGIIQVEVAKDKVEYARKKGLFWFKEASRKSGITPWVKDTSKESGKFILRKAFDGIVAIAMEAAATTWNIVIGFFKGALTGDWEQYDKGKLHVMLAVAFTFALYALIRYVYWYIAPFVDWIPRTLKFGVRWGKKARKVPFSFFFTGYVRDFRTIKGSVRLDDIVTSALMNSQTMVVQDEGFIKHTAKRMAGRAD